MQIQKHKSICFGLLLEGLCFLQI